MPRKSKTKVDISAGKILISEPFFPDSYFKRSVVLLCEHNQDGTLGFILNKPTNLKLTDVLKDFPTFDAPLNFGGPVRTESIHFLHTLGDTLEGSKKITTGVYWGGNYGVLRMLIEAGEVSEDEVRFFAGYSGWEPGQLEDEFRRKSWLASSAKKEFAFSNHPEELWGEILRIMGSQYAVLANFPEDPSLN